MERALLALPVFCGLLVGCGGGETKPERIPERALERRNLYLHQGWVASLAISPDQKRFASGAYDATLRLWSLITLEPKVSRQAHSKWVRSVAFSPDGKYLASGGGDDRAFLWDADKASYVRAFSGHSKQIDAVDFSPDSKTLLTGSWDGTLKLWNVETGKEIKTFTGHSHRVYCVRFSPDGKLVASGSGIDEKPKKGVDSGELHIREVSSGKLLWKLKAHAQWITMVAFHPDGKRLITASYFDPGPVKLWDIQAQKEIPFPGKMTSTVSSLAISSGGNYLITGCFDGSIRLWDLALGKEALTLTGHPGEVSCVAISPDGKTLLSGGESIVHGGLIKVWDLPRAFR